jgi:hypothetical protein
MANVTLELVFESAAPGIWSGVQVGSGSAGSVSEVVIATEEPLVFRVEANATIECCTVKWKGPSIQKDAKGPFIYVRHGQSAGQSGTECNRRAKLYLSSIRPEQVSSDRVVLRAVFPGKANDGLPSCATVKPIQDWTAV